ncbi:MAG: hypothetical protein F4X39_09805 [Acidobacteriia bacterium]|nr:hypothetical protein [Terriglobia bacterium]
MPGTNNQNGKDLTGLAHLRQSVRDILTTPIGTRVMRREYGSRLFELLDAPLTPGTLTEIYAAAAEALARWEPRLRVDRIQAHEAGGSDAKGHVSIDLEGVYLPGGRPVRIEGLVI